MAQRCIDHIFNKEGDCLYIADAQARDQLAALGRKDYPVGFVIHSQVEIDPHLLFGGAWLYDMDFHGFRKLHIYTKIPDETGEEAPDAPEGTPEAGDAEGGEEE